MAGSWRHLVDAEGRFIGTDHLDNLGDAHEALEECYGIVQLLSGGDDAVIDAARIRYVEGLRLRGVQPWSPHHAAPPPGAPPAPVPARLPASGERVIVVGRGPRGWQVVEPGRGEDQGGPLRGTYASEAEAERVAAALRARDAGAPEPTAPMLEEDDAPGDCPHCGALVRPGQWLQHGRWHGQLLVAWRSLGGTVGP